MSVHQMARVWTLDLAPSDKLVLLALADFASDDGQCWPSIERIVEMCGLGRRTVMRCLRSLEDAGLVSVEHNRGRHRTNMYRLAIPEGDVGGDPEKVPMATEKGATAARFADQKGAICAEKVPSDARKGATVAPKPSEPPIDYTTLLGARAHDDPSIDDHQPKSASPEPPQASPTHRERLLKAMGADPVSGLTGPDGRMIGTVTDMARARRWRDELGLSIDEQLAVVRDVVARQRSRDPRWLPRSFAYFDGPMAELARAKAQPVKPTACDTPATGTRPSTRAQQPAKDIFQAVIEKARRGEL